MRGQDRRPPHGGEDRIRKKIKLIKQKQYVFSQDQFRANHRLTRKLILDSPDFPCKIYYPFQSIHRVQSDYIKQVLQALQNKKQLIIQSPTGTGKTLCLLTSVLAWAENFYKNSQNSTRLNIIYTSNLHSQLQQIKDQVALTCYRPNMIIYGSRQKFCINQKITNSKLNYNQWTSQCDKAILQRRNRNLFKYEARKIINRLKHLNYENVEQIEEDLKTLVQQSSQTQQRFQYHQDQDWQLNLNALNLDGCLARLRHIRSQLLKKGNTCKYFRGQSFNNQFEKNILNENQRKPLSVPEMKAKGREQIFCPYFFPKRLRQFQKQRQVKQYDSIKRFQRQNDLITQNRIELQVNQLKKQEVKGLILMPYNYLLNQKMIDISKSLIKNSIIIFDEGHNVLTKAAQGSNYNFNNNMLETCYQNISNYQKYLEKLNANQMQDQGILQEQIYEQNGNMNINNTPNIQILKRIITTMQNNYTQYFNNEKTDFFDQYDEQNLYDSFQEQVNISNSQQETRVKKTKKRYMTQIQPIKIKQYLKKIYFSPNIPHNYNENQDTTTTCEVFRYLEYLRKLVRIVISQLDSSRQFHFKLDNFEIALSKIILLLGDNEEHRKQYFLHISQWFQTKKKQSKFKGNVRFRCLTARYMFDTLRRYNPYNIIITSGTLIPSTEWLSQRQFKNPNQQITFFPNDPIIDAQKILVRIVSKDLQGNQMSFQSKHFKTKQYSRINAFNQTIKNCFSSIIQIIQKAQIPKGILIILPTYRILAHFKGCLYDQINSTFLNKLQSLKKLHFQVKGSYIQTKNNYLKDSIQGKGAILFCVYRGKLSQGIDFKDDFCRSVFSIGIPLASGYQPFVKYKLQRQSKWIINEAARAVSQGVGRAIRHQNDFGSIIFFDSRFRKAQHNDGGSVIKKISKFVAQKNQPSRNYNDLIKQLKDFYKERYQKFQEYKRLQALNNNR